jgi:metal-sulfur cluster biosynthetic enzyme
MNDDLPARIRESLRIVIDPELGHNIVDLGFVYGIAVTDGDAWIVMTATTKGCPAASFLKDGVANAAMQVPGVRSVDVTMTFDPPWTPSMIAPEVSASIGFAPVH